MPSKTGLDKVVPAVAELICPERVGYFMQGFHRVFSRGVFTKDDAALMLGVARPVIWASKQPQA